MTHIAWTEVTWNVVSGCTRISDGCDRCYIERTPPLRMARRRFDHPGIGGSTDVQLHPDRLLRPVTWRAPRRVFVCSLADLFHDTVPDLHIAKTWATMARTPRHTYQVLTKRPARMLALLSSDTFRDAVVQTLMEEPGLSRPKDGWPIPKGGLAWPLPNVWCGVTAESQKWADVRVPILRRTPAAVRWVSVEPMLGLIRLPQICGCGCGKPLAHARREAVLNPGYLNPDQAEAEVEDSATAGLDWVVVGCESGPGARPMDLEWVEQIVHDCQQAGIPVFVKQLPTGPRGRATQDITTFPEALRVRQYPGEADHGQ